MGCYNRRTIAGLMLALAFFSIAFLLRPPRFNPLAPAEALFPRWSEQSLGNVMPHQKLVRTFHLTNRGYKKVAILGSDSQCGLGCVEALGLPLEVVRGEATIPVEVVTPKQPGPFSLTVTLFTENSDQVTLPLTVKGCILPAQDDGDRLGAYNTPTQ